MVPLGGGQVTGAEVGGGAHAAGGEDAEELVEVRVGGVVAGVEGVGEGLGGCGVDCEAAGGRLGCESDKRC